MMQFSSESSAKFEAIEMLNKLECFSILQFLEMAWILVLLISFPLVAYLCVLLVNFKLFI
jgi:hypothetical protein